MSSAAIQASGDEQTAYQSAVDLILKDRNYDGAITAFKDFQINILIQGMQVTLTIG